MQSTQICAIGTAVPKYGYRQQQVAAFMKRVLDADAVLSRRIDYLYHRSQIDTRYSCLADYGCAEPRQFEFYPPNWCLEPFPTTQQRMVKYRAEALPLCLEAIADAQCQPKAPELKTVTHLIVVSCTGFYAPGLDIDLVKTLGLSPNVQRTIVGFMGCHAAFNGLRLADSICRTDSTATALMVCVELCTLHFQRSKSRHHLVSNSIFADGAAVVFFTAQSQAERSLPVLTIRHSVSLLDDDSLGEMAWTISDTGFEMQISPDIPRILNVNLPDFVLRLLKPNRLVRNEVDFWAVHPGGPAILDAVQQCLEIPTHKMADSRTVLQNYGNMSSPSVLFVLKRLCERLALGESSRYCAAIAFGPGLTLEGCLLEVCQ